MQAGIQNGDYTAIRCITWSVGGLPRGVDCKYLIAAWQQVMTEAPMEAFHVTVFPPLLYSDSGLLASDS